MLASNVKVMIDPTAALSRRSRYSRASMF